MERTCILMSDRSGSWLPDSPLISWMSLRELLSLSEARLPHLSLRNLTGSS